MATPEASSQPAEGAPPAESIRVRGQVQGVGCRPFVWRLAARLGVAGEVRNDAEGVLQDIHWSGGAFGYFPSYSLGNMLAAQLWYAALEALPGLEDDFARGDFSRLLLWLRDSVHRHGARYPLCELAQIATGQPLSPKALLRYLEERYLPIYC